MFQNVYMVFVKTYLCGMQISLRKQYLYICVQAVPLDIYT
jgi:hypothetical protein